MGWISSAVSAVTKVVDVATGGVIGKHISNALKAMGLPPAICNIVAMIGDPSYSTKAICEEIDRVGKALGLPPALTGALKKLVEKAEEYTKAFAQGGFGGLVMAVGKDLGLPDWLCHGLAAAIDAYTGNAAGAAAHLMALAAECAKALGVPDSAMDIVLFAADAYAGDVKGAAGHALQVGADVLDTLDIAPEFKALGHMAADGFSGDTKGAQAHALEFAGHVMQRMGAPPEVTGLIKLAVAYDQGDKEGMKAAAKEVAGQLINRIPNLPPIIANKLTSALNSAIDDPKKALETIKDLPAQIANLPEQAKAAAQSVIDTIAGLATDKTAEQDGKTSDTDWKKLSGNLLEKGKSYLPPEAQKAYEVGLNIVHGDKEALKKNLKELTDAGKEVGKGVLNNLKGRVDSDLLKELQMFIDDDKKGVEKLLTGKNHVTSNELDDELAKLGVPIRA
jgi:hypothetical protein